MLFGKPSIDFLLVGLGNPEEKYAATRHNIGFRCIDRLAQEKRFKLNRLRCRAWTGLVRLDGLQVLAAKPTTYMNLSGESVRALAAYYHVPPARIIVIYDDVSLPVGRMRIRAEGSAGGHNGIKSIIAELGTQEFPRIRIGVGEKPHPDYDLADWVLSRFSANEEKRLADVIGWAGEAALEIMKNGCVSAANRFNGRSAQ